MLLEYRKELSRSYLIAKGIPCDKTKEYQYRMIVNNQIQGLLPCSERNVEGEVYLYYDITSRQSMLQLYETKKMKFGDILNLMEDIIHILENIAEYLLDEKYLLLDPVYIFIDLETERPACIFYPYGEKGDGWTKTYEQLADFLLEHVDHTQEQAVNAAYQFYKLSKSEYFALQTFLPFLNKEKGTIKERTETAEFPDSKIMNPEGEFLSPEEMTDKGGSETVRAKPFPFGRLTAFIMSGLGTGAAIGYLLYRKPEGEQGLLILGIAAAAGAVFLLLGWRLIKELLKKQEDEEIQETEEEIYPVWSPCEEVREEAQYGETVYIGKGAEADAKDTAVSKITGRQGKKDIQFLLENLPVTVGKLEGKAQIVLQESSVSRVHARFVEKDGRIALMDMNSTNGTFLNGIRLEQGETLSLEDGDEIRFGRSVFQFEISEC